MASYLHTFGQMREYRDVEADVPSLKVVLLGDSGVGKSSLMYRFVTCADKPEYDNVVCPTIGVDFAQRCYGCDGKIFKMQIWDTAGQEKFKSIVRMYYRDAKVFVLIYDVTREDTFRSLESWYHSILETLGLTFDEFNKEHHVMIIGNKADRPTREKRVLTETAKKFAEDHQANFLETCAIRRFSWSEYITNPFLELSKEIMKKFEILHVVRQKEKPVTVKLSLNNDIEAEKMYSSYWCCWNYIPSRPSFLRSSATET